MSDIADTPVPAPAVAVPVVAVPSAVFTPVLHTVHEAYSFACMKCGYGWEQAYEIEHHVDGSGHPFIVYTANGERVPSPLSHPTCLNCGGHVVRIMRAGQVSSVQHTLDQLYHHPVAPGIAGPVPSGPDRPRRPKAPKPARPRKTSRMHDVPGPVAIDPQAELRGPLARLRAWLRGPAA